MDTLAIYKHGEMSLQTTAYDDNGVIRCRFSGYLAGKEKDLTVDEYLATHEGFKCLPIDEAIKHIHDTESIKLIGSWVEITEDQYMEALECLPPQKWLTVDRVNIFRMSEYTTGNITAHYARTANRYFTALRRTSVSYETIAQEVKAIN
jgi:hypothetical protein